MTCFLPVPVNGCEAKGHGEIAKRYQVQIDGSEVRCHDEIVSVRAKNKAPARRPASQRCCPGRSNCPVVPKLVDDLNFSLIDFGTDCDTVLAGGRHLIKPSELWLVLLIDHSVFVLKSTVQSSGILDIKAKFKLTPNIETQSPEYFLMKIL